MCHIQGLFSCSELLCAGFRLVEPITVMVGGAVAEVTASDHDSIEFVYPDISPMDTTIVVQSQGRMSNHVAIAVLADTAGQTQPQGGPFGEQPKYAQKTIPSQKV